MNILDALHTPELFGDAFTGDSWNRWRSVLAGAFALPMTDDELTLFKEVSGGREPPSERVRELWCIVGRRAAKTHTAASVAVYMATVGAALEGLTDKLAPGERGVIAILATDRNQAKVALNYIHGMFDDSPVFRAMIEKRGAESIDLNNRVSIEVGTSNHRAIRGRTLLAVIFDEVAFFRSEQTQNPDVEIYRAASPGLATTGGLMIGISSPYAKRGLLYDKYRKHYGQNSDVLVVKGATRDFNPTLDQKIVDDAIQDDPEAAKTEWLGEFRDGIASFIERSLIEDSTRRTPLIMPRQNNRKHHAFVDVAGGGKDAYTLAIAFKDGEKVIICGVWARHGDPAEITGEYAKIMRSYGINRCTGDRYAAAWPVSEYQKHGVTMTNSELNRSELYKEVLPLLQTGTIELPPDTKLTNEFSMLERRTGRNGKDTIDHPIAGHDDRANAVAGAAYLAKQKRELPRVHFNMD